MALSGASHRFIDNDSSDGPLSSENINSLDMGGNVYKSPNGGLNVRVTAIRGLFATTDTAYAGAATDQAMTNNATNYLYLNTSGVLVINTTGFPGDTTTYFPLATVVTSAGAITSITDRRWRFRVG